MAHPNAKDASASKNAKMRAMTAHYGDANPSMKKLARVDKAKEEGPEDSVGYGADSDAPNARSDRPARKTTSANPVATYAQGGAVARAKGGRAKHKGAGHTHVNIMIGPGGAGAGAPGATPPPVIPPGPPPAMAAPPAPPHPMMGPPGMPPGGPGGGPPMPPPGSMPPPGLPPRAKGGKVAHSDDKEDRKLVKELVKSDALKHAGRASGGRAPRMPHLTGSPVTGVGRLEHTKTQAKDKHKPEEITG